MVWCAHAALNSSTFHGRLPMLIARNHPTSHHGMPAPTHHQHSKHLLTAKPAAVKCSHDPRHAVCRVAFSGRSIQPLLYCKKNNKKVKYETSCYRSLCKFIFYFFCILHYADEKSEQYYGTTWQWCVDDIECHTRHAWLSLPPLVGLDLDRAPCVVHVGLNAYT